MWELASCSSHHLCASILKYVNLQFYYVFLKVTVSSCWYIVKYVRDMYKLISPNLVNAFKWIIFLFLKILQKLMIFICIYICLYMFIFWYVRIVRYIKLKSLRKIIENNFFCVCEKKRIQKLTGYYIQIIFNIPLFSLFLYCLEKFEIYLRKSIKIVKI